MSYQTAGEGRRIQQQGNRTGIPPHIQKRCEAMSGVSFDDVRIHYGSGKPAELGALAYTQGSHVYIGPGQERYLGHELGHVMQQKRGRVKPNMFFRGMAVNDDRSLEREADRIGGTVQGAPALRDASLNVLCPSFAIGKDAGRRSIQGKNLCGMSVAAGREVSN